MAGVRISGLHKRFAAVHAVRGIDLDIPDGEFTVLVGPSGCGKSTLLRTIAGLEEIDDGVIEIGGRVVNGTRPRDRDVAMVFQDYALYPHMTVFGNISLSLRARRMAKAEIEPRVRRVAEMLGIVTLLERYPEGSDSGSRSDELSCAIHAFFCSTNRCPTSTPSCATRCAPRSSACIKRSRRP
jgi:multiple sugar transport system ATP-binding protein